MNNVRQSNSAILKQNNIFPKSEHLCGEKNLTRLFTQGKAFIAYPLRVVYLFEERKNADEIAKIVVITSKKRHKKAVDRNRLKRLMREAYRLNKHDFCAILQEKNKQALVAFHYVADEKMPFAEVEKKMKRALEKLTDLMVDE